MCEVSAYPVPQFSWYKDGALLAGEIESVLLIRQMQWTDEGTYICQAVNKAGVKRSQQKALDIWDILKPIVTSSHNGFVPIGSNVVMTCAMAPNSEGELSWWKDGSLLQSSPVLSLMNVTNENSGVYMCTTQNLNKIMWSDPIELKVMYLKAVTISSLHSTSVIENTTVSLSCSVVSFPAVTSFVWKVDNQTIGNDSIINIVVTKPESYTCQVEHPLTSAQQTISIDMLYLREPVLQSSASVLMEGDTGILQCLVNSNPVPVYRWYHNNILLNRNNSYLILNNSTEQDEGEYRCKVQNPARESLSNSLYLPVYYARNCRASANSTQLIENEALTLQCTVESSPSVMSWRWKFNGEVISHTSKSTLNNVTRHQGGVYECIAEHPAGVLRDQLTVHVQYITKPTFRISNAETIIEGDSISLYCDSESDSQINYTWYYERGILDYNTSVVTIRAHRSIIGTYYCKVESLAGVKVSNALHINVMYLDKPAVTMPEHPPRFGEDYNLSCSAAANPPLSGASYAWKVSGRVVAYGNVLTLHNVTAEMTGMYECTVRNTIGVSLGHQLTVQYLTEPVIKSNPTGLIREFDDVILLCDVSGTIPLNFSWYKDNAKLEVTESAIAMPNLTRDATGFYQCLVQNTYANKSSQIHFLNVLYLSDPMVGESEVNIIRNNYLTLNCSCISNPPAKFSWWKDDALITTNSSLSVENIELHHEGRYTCKVKNTVGEKSASVQVSVRYLDSPVLRLSSPTTVVEGTLLVFTCEASGSGKFSYQLKKDMSDVVGSGSVTILGNAQRSYQGNYTCYVFNHVGIKQSQTIPLNIIYLDSPTITQRNTANGFLFNCSSEGNPPPSFVWRDNNVILSNTNQLLVKKLNSSYVVDYICTVKNEVAELSVSTKASTQYLKKPVLSVTPPSSPNEGETIVFYCDVDATKPVVYSWFVNRNKIPGENAVLMTLYSVKRGNSGEYYCQVTNGAGIKSSNLILLQVWYIDVPMISVERPDKDIVRRGDNINLTCSTFSNTKIIYTWLHNDVYIANYPSLMLNKVTMDSEGKYTCNVTNKRIERMAVFEFQVQYLDKPLLTITPGESVLEEETVVMKCNVNATGYPKYQWFKDNQTLSETSDKITFGKIKRIDMGQYTCHVTSEVSELVSNLIVLDIKYIDPPVVYATNTTMVSNLGTTLSCQSSGVPPVAYTWRFGTKVVGNNKTYTITRAALKDKGTYTCVVSNEVGEWTGVVYLDYQYLLTPVIRAYQPTEVNQGSSLVLSCHAGGTTPIEYTWIFNNNTNVTTKQPSAMTTNRPSVVTTNQFSTVTTNRSLLVVHNISRHHTGQHHCKASNVHSTEYSQPFILTVNYLDTPFINRTVRESTIELECIVTGYPTPLIIWKENNKVVSNSQQLVVNRQHSHNKHYECSAENKAGFKSSTQQGANTFLSDPFITSDDKAIEGELLKMNCMVNSSSPTHYTWYKNQQPIPKQHSRDFVLPSVVPSDRGQYKCIVNNGVTVKESQNHMIQILYLKEPKIPSKESTVNEGESVFVPCYCNGNPHTVDYSWSRDGVEVASSFSLEFENIQVEKSGVYICTCNNTAVVKSVRFQITVNYIGEPIVRSSSTSTTSESDDVMLICHVNGTLPIAYHWLKNNNTLPGHTSNVLLLKKIDRSQAGFYTCCASNVVKRVVSREVDVTIAYVDKPTTESKTQYIKGEHVTIRCISIGYPYVFYTWYKQNNIISNQSVLTFESIQPIDEDFYRCTVSNNIERKSSAFQLNVKYLNDPVLKVTPLNHAGGSGILDCNVEGTQPLVYTWFKNNKLIDTNSTSIHAIYHLTKQDTGQYRCNVKNLIAEKSSNPVQLTVNYLETPVISKKETIDNGVHRIVLECSIDSYPPATLRWLRNGAYITKGASLVLEGVNGSRSGAYECGGHNLVGNKQKSVNVEIKYQQMPHVTIEPSSIYEGNSVVLICHVTASQPLAYKWHANNSLRSVHRTLTINYVTRLAHANYTCSVSNELGQITSHPVLLNVKYIDTPVMNVSSATIVEGDNARVTCIGYGNPPPDLTMQKRASLTIPGGSIEIKNAKLLDEGKITCISRNSAGQKNTSLLLTVDYMHAPRLLPNGVVRLLEGSSLTIACLARTTFENHLQYTWYENGNIMRNTTSSHLTIPSPTYKHTYSCQTTFQHVSKTSFQNTTVYVTSGSTEIPTCEDSKEVVLNEDKLTCECKDGFYGDRCQNKYQIVQASVSIDRVCNVTQCYSGPSLYQRTKDATFYRALKNNFEQQLLEAFNEETTKVLNIRLVSFDYGSWLQLDYLIYFDKRMSKTKEELQRLVTIISMKHFSYVQNKPFSFQLNSQASVVSGYDHCTEGLVRCDANARCLNGLTGYYCRCNHGYQGNGNTCEEVKQIMCQNDYQKQMLLTLMIVLSVLVVAVVIGCSVALRCRKSSKRSKFSADPVFDIYKSTCSLPETPSHCGSVALYDSNADEFKEHHSYESWRHFAR